MDYNQMLADGLITQEAFDMLTASPAPDPVPTPAPDPVPTPEPDYFANYVKEM